MWTKNTYLSGHQHTRDYSFRTCFASLSTFAITIYRLLLVIQSLRFYIIRLDLLFVKYFSGVAKVDNEICKPFVQKNSVFFVCRLFWVWRWLFGFQRYWIWTCWILCYWVPASLSNLSRLSILDLRSWWYLRFVQCPTKPCILWSWLHKWPKSVPLMNLNELIFQQNVIFHLAAQRWPNLLWGRFNNTLHIMVL